MAYGITLVFEGVGEDQYWAVNEKLGIARDNTGARPDGLIRHAAGPIPTGWVVMEVWESKRHQEQFMASRLGGALGAVGLPAPAQVIDSELVNTFGR